MGCNKGLPRLELQLRIGQTLQSHLEVGGGDRFLNHGFHKNLHMQ
jgi:hypothetical protein